MTIWFVACLLLMAALPAVLIALRPLPALLAVIAICAGWMLMLRLAPGLEMAGGMLLFGSWGISAVTALAAIGIRISDARSARSGYRS